MAHVSNSTLFAHIKGIRKIKDALVVLVKTEWNAAIVDELEAGCKTVLAQNNIRTKTIVVPGAVEIPFAVHQYWENKRGKKEADAFVALGCVIRGGTPHFDYVCQGVTFGVTQLNTVLPVPVIFGVLTVDNTQQADERLGGVHGHKGEEAAITAMKMMLLNRKLKKAKR